MNFDDSNSGDKVYKLVIEFTEENADWRRTDFLCKLLHSQNGKLIEKAWDLAGSLEQRNQIYIGILCKEMWKRKDESLRVI